MCSLPLGIPIEFQTQQLTFFPPNFNCLPPPCSPPLSFYLSACVCVCVGSPLLRLKSSRGIESLKRRLRIPQRPATGDRRAIEHPRPASFISIWLVFDCFGLNARGEWRARQRWMALWNHRPRRLAGRTPRWTSSCRMAWAVGNCSRTVMVSPTSEWYPKLMALPVPVTH